jgi:hypothetical protein
MKKDLIIVGLAFCLLIQFGVSIKNSYHLSKLEKDLKDTVDVVYWLNDKLDNSYLMIDSLNKEITNNWKELEDYKDLRRIKKELDRSN